MSEAQGNERIEDWVAKEGKARGRGNGKKMVFIIAIIAVVLIAIIGTVIFLANRKKATPADKMNYLAGLDVMCGPNGIVSVGNGEFLVTDVYGKKIWKVNVNGTASVYAGAETQKDASGQPIGGYQDGLLLEALFQEPWAIVPFMNGYAVTDAGNHAVRYLSDTDVQTLNGYNSKLEMGDMGVTFERPTGLAVDEQGRLYVADTARGEIYQIDSTGAVNVYASDLNSPTGLCWSNGALYVAETGENRIISLKDGKVTTIAGTGEEGDKDGIASVATFSSPQGVTVGDDGTIYVGDTTNGFIRRIKDGKVDTILQMEPDTLTTYPLSPTGACCEGDKLYVCDVFSRKVYVLQTK